jgi:hypothetical protein
MSSFGARRVVPGTPGKFSAFCINLYSLLPQRWERMIKFRGKSIQLLPKPTDSYAN